MAFLWKQSILRVTVSLHYGRVIFFVNTYSSSFLELHLVIVTI